MTMNPHTTASGLRAEAKATARAQVDQGGVAARRADGKRIIGPAALLSAAFIVAVTCIAKVFYD